MKLLAPFAGTVVAVPHEPNETIAAGTPVIVLEAMKMEHELTAETDATIEALNVQAGDAVTEGQLLATLTAAANGNPPPAPLPDRNGPKWPTDRGPGPPRDRPATKPGPKPSGSATTAATGPPAKT